MGHGILLVVFAGLVIPCGVGENSHLLYGLEGIVDPINPDRKTQ